MPSYRYTQEQLDYLRDEYKRKTVPELTKAFNAKFGLNKGDLAIQSLLAYHRFRSGRNPGEHIWQRGERYTPEQLDFLREGYKHMVTHELTEAFNKRFGQARTVQAIQGTLTGHDLRKDRNEGMPTSMPREIGSERVCPVSGFIVLRTADKRPRRGGDSRQRHKHRVVWEQNAGPIPEGHRVRFLDGNRQNCYIDNLALFTRTENMFLNHLKFNSAPDELRETIVLTARLKAKACERRKELLESEGVGIELRPEEA